MELMPFGPIESSLARSEAVTLKMNDKYIGKVNRHIAASFDTCHLSFSTTLNENSLHKNLRAQALSSGSKPNAMNFFSDGN